MGDPKANNPYGVSRVQTLVDFLENNKLVKVAAEKTRDQSKIAELDAGDLIAYFNPVKAGFTHLAFYLGGNKEPRRGPGVQVDNASFPVSSF